jgi:glutaredoxin 3
LKYKALSRVNRALRAWMERAKELCESKIWGILEVGKATKFRKEKRIMMGEPIKIYQLEGCPYCRRVKDTLEAKGIAYEKIENDSDEVGAKIMEISNQSLVPVIVDGDKVINDSQKIIDYLNENY